MNGLHSATPAKGSPRSVKLSPELNEFLHMLDALEDQAKGQDTKSARK